MDEADTLFAALHEKKDSAIEKIYGALLQFATSSDATYAMRKKSIQQTGGKACKFDKIRARGIKEPHLTMLGSAIPKYLYSALSERAMENGLLSRRLILEAGARGKAGYLVSLGGFAAGARRRCTISATTTRTAHSRTDSCCGISTSTPTRCDGQSTRSCRAISSQPKP